MKLISTVAMTAALTIASAFAASAQVHHTGTSTGPNGQSVITNGNTSCSGLGCSHQRTTTGPNGRQSTANTGTTCVNGICTRNAVRTGVRGHAYSHTGTTTRP